MEVRREPYVEPATQRSVEVLSDLCTDVGIVVDGTLEGGLAVGGALGLEHDGVAEVGDAANEGVSSERYSTVAG